MRLGIIARSDNTGLGNQTRELVNMLKPDKILLVNSYGFNENEQHPEWYEGYDIVHTTTRGMPRDSETINFLRGLDVVVSCETFYNSNFAGFARRKGVKTILQYNYEFLENLNNDKAKFPDVFLAPSLWNFDIMTERFGKFVKVVHLPPPTDPKPFEIVKNNNMSKDHKRILHIGGKAAAKDRNGTNTVIEMLKHSKADYELVIKTQTVLDIDCNDPRLTIEVDNPENREDMYNGFDAMVLPRRYAGLCLPMNEALLSGLPVFMTDVSPNNTILPHDWLIESNKIDELKTKAVIDVYEADAIKLAEKIDNFVNNKDKLSIKEYAYQTGIDNFSPDVLKDKYLEIIGK